MMETRRPNIVLILADDMGYSDIGCFGSEIATPNIDRLASQGVRFTQMYNCARCCPSRASLLTGLYPHQAGVGHMTSDLGHPSYRGHLNRRCATLAEVLQAGGYSTLMAGKWHVGGMLDLRRPEGWRPGDEGHPSPVTRGFQRFYGTLEGCCSYYNPHTLMDDGRFVTPDTDGYYYTDAITDHAMAMIGQYGGRPQPFFLYVAYTAPHWPLHAPSEDIAHYEGRYRRGWDATRKDRYDRLVELKIVDSKWALSPRDEQAPPWDEVRDRDWEDRRMAVYAAQVDRMDQGVGRILGKLRDMGIRENTLVMFLSDNGGCAEFLAEDGFVQNVLWPMRGGGHVRAGNFPGVMPGSEDTYQSYDLPWANVSNTPFRLFKHWVHEGGIATPLVVSWPEVIRTARLERAPAHVIDVMATVVEASGAAYPGELAGHPIQPMEGESLLPALRGPGWSRQRPLYWEHEGNCAIRAGDWKMVRRYPGGWELYNLERDRTEQRDLIGKEKKRAGALEKLYNAWAEARGVLPVEDLVKIAPIEDFPTFHETEDRE